MKGYCPYSGCTELNDTFYGISHPYENSCVNKCINCNQWSLYNPDNGGQTELPEELRIDEAWELNN